jgi:beta-lactam-binding protein with PASTA domain/predicted Ser/Thr protein kinase
MTVLAGRYQLLQQVGEGGMGVVWHARDLELERDVAIKLLRPFVAQDPEQARRFHREARTLAGLTHEHIVRVYDYVSDTEQSFLVMEYVDGGNLAATTRRRLPLTTSEASAYAQPVAAALAYAHGKGVVHRDLTPANILIQQGSGRVVTTDFGLARIARSSGSLPVTAMGVLLGTPEFWSPEQALGRESGAAADMYALGCILFLLLTGHLPFEGDDRLNVGLRRAHEDAPSLRTWLPAAPATAIALVDALLARDPAERPEAPAAALALSDLSSDTATVAAAVATISDEGPRTMAFASERPTTQVAAERPTVRGLRRRASRRLLAASAAAAGVIIVALLLAGGVRDPLLHMPNVVALREDAARAQIMRTLPRANVSVERVYSMRVASGRVIRQRPSPRIALAKAPEVRLVVSRGTPFAAVPALAGVPAGKAGALLARQGFRSRYAYAPSWVVRKGSVVGLKPRAGTRVRRPATLTLVIASGYPRTVVPEVRNVDLAAAKAQLASYDLRYRLVWRLTDEAEPGQVLEQIPSAGTSVYEGAQIRLTVARTLRWVKVFSASGTADYESEAFTVPQHWRIRYRLVPNEFGLAVAQVGWAREGDDTGATRSFLASGSGALHTYVTSDGAGTYRLGVRPYAGTRWYVEVDVLK